MLCFAHFLYVTSGSPDPYTSTPAIAEEAFESDGVLARPISLVEKEGPVGMEQEAKEGEGTLEGFKTVDV